MVFEEELLHNTVRLLGQISFELCTGLCVINVTIKLTIMTDDVAVSLNYTLIIHFSIHMYM